MNVEYVKCWRNKRFEWRWRIREGGIKQCHFYGGYAYPVDDEDQGVILAQGTTFYRTQHEARAELVRITDALADWVAHEQIRALSGEL